ncbi:MAG: carbohydrate-binding family 9-like protein [Fimbriiglobus sp.]|nr:carbohydrate-binding family 9-like protein [Fimbriiglobus sp.]
MTSLRRLALALPILLVVPIVAADPAPTPDALPPKGYVCYLAGKAPTIDGKLDDDCWKGVPWTDDFVDIEGDKKPKPAHRTRAKMTWNDKALYIAAEITEPHVWATLTEHDSVIFADPDFEVFIDPDGDNHLYAELELNAKNTTWDLLLTKPYKDGGKAINAWEITDLKTAVKVNGTLNDPSDKDIGWTVEIAWPWGSLIELGNKVSLPKDGDRWRINFSRVEWDFEVKDGKYVKIPKRQEHNWVWSPQGVIDMHRPERWGYLQFSTKADGVKYEPDPAQAIKDALHRVYYAQRDHHGKNKKFTANVADLGVKADGVEVQTTWNGFEATATSKNGNRWTIREDGRLTRE